VATDDEGCQARQARGMNSLDRAHSFYGLWSNPLIFAKPRI
jgi:hypothetical protein